MPLSNEQLIISVDDIREYTAISDNFDAQILASVIIRSQDTNCQQILGTALTQKLITDYNAGTLAGVYEELYDSEKASVKKMVVWQSFIYGLTRMMFKVQNNGISKSGGDIGTDAAVITNDDLGIMKRDGAAALANYENMVKQYLAQNYSSFPELQNNTPEYLKPDLTESKTDYGISSTPNKVFSDI